MQPYLRTRQEQDRRSLWTGLGVTVAAHAIALAVCLTSGLKYLDPPPPETSFLIDFEEEIQEQERPMETRVGRRRRKWTARRKWNWSRRPNRPM